MEHLRRVCTVRTDGAGRLQQLKELVPDSDYVLCEIATERSVPSCKSPEDVAGWIEHCVLGDLYTLLLGIRATDTAQGAAARAEHRLGGANFLLSAGCCMALEFFGQVYGVGADATTRAKNYTAKFLAPVDPRYSEYFELLWRSFRNGIVHGSWPKSIALSERAGERIAVGANNDAKGRHFESEPSFDGPTLVVSGARFLDDLTASFDQGFRDWILSDSDPDVCERASARLLLIKEGDITARQQFTGVMEWAAK